ncbi:hypothetical protein KBD33_04640 [Candidatus Gracilibacteria bacterium]|nr:hypothetical protein [Candidatus Gracilibacteria bacterium]
MELDITYETLKQSLNTLTNVQGEDCVILSKEVAQHISKLLELQNIPSENTIEQVTTMIPKLSKEEVQARRDEVRVMVDNKKPKDEIPFYQGKRSEHGTAQDFFRKYYSPYIESGQEVLFAPELKTIDEKLLIALRNECRNGIPMPLGDRSKKTEALFERRFLDKDSRHDRVSYTMAIRNYRKTL